MDDAAWAALPWHRRHPMRALMLTALIPLAVGAVAFVAVVWWVSGLSARHPSYLTALAAVRTNPAVVAELGEPIEPGRLVTGTTTDEAGRRAELMFNVTGPRAAAGVRLVARADAAADGGWTLTFLDVGVNRPDGSQRVLTLITDEQPVRFAPPVEENPTDAGPPATPAPE